MGCRVLRLLSRGQLDPYAPGGDEVYSLFRQAANWPELLPPGHTFSIQARVASCSDVPSSMLVQIRGRDAICDSIRDARLDFLAYAMHLLLCAAMYHTFSTSSIVQQDQVSPSKVILIIHG